MGRGTGGLSRRHGRERAGVESGKLGVCGYWDLGTI